MTLSKSSFFLLPNNNNNIQTMKKKKSRKRERKLLSVPRSTLPLREKERERVSFVYTLTVRHLIHQVDRKRERNMADHHS
jgi:hypothetical protein